MPNTAPTLSIDASSANGSFDFTSYLSTFFSGLPNAAYAFYGGVPDQAYGSTFWMNGSQLAFTFSNSNKIVLVEGADLAYDGIHSPGNGHGISGTVQKITFGSTDANTVPSDGPNGHGVLTGVIADVVFDGWTMSAAVGAGPNPQNPVYTLYNQLLKGGTDATAVPALYQTIGAYAYGVSGSLHSDTLRGTAQGDVINGAGGDDVVYASLGTDTIDGGGNMDRVIFAGAKSEYTVSAASDGAVTVSRADGQGTSTLRNVETARFDDVEVDLFTLVEEAAGRPPSNLTFSGVSIDENAAMATEIGRLSATDPEGKAITYTLKSSSGGRFALVDNAIALSGAIDYETSRSHVITVEARDEDGDVTSADFSIDVNDVNEAPTDLFLSKASVKENAEAGTRVGTLSAFDPEGDAVTFTLASNAGGRFELDGNNIVLAKTLDYDKAQSHKATIVATDSKGASASYVVTLHVDDVAKTIIAKSSGGHSAGGAGVDMIKGSAQADYVYGGAGSDQLRGGAGNDILSGQSGQDQIWGGTGSDHVNGGTGADRLWGQSGHDVLFGGAGADRISGGTGADTFVFKTIKDSTTDPIGRDTIVDFSRKAGDKIDLSAIDANVNRKGNQAFSFIGQSEFHQKAGELRYEKAAGQTFVSGDANGDGLADFSIHLASALNVTKSYFIL
jgi:hypothetical protein